MRRYGLKTIRALNLFSIVDVLMTFCLFNNECDALLVFDYINSQHYNIKFTMEKEENHQPPFLDVLDNGQSEFPVTSVFRKPSFTPSSYKLGLIRTLAIPGKVFMKT